MDFHQIKYWGVLWKIVNHIKFHVDQTRKRFEVLTVVKMTVLFFWVVTSCGLNVSEKHTVPIFQAEAGVYQPKS
jgi:hypothetical protein